MNTDSLISLILRNQLKHYLFLNSDAIRLSPVPEVPGGAKGFILLPPDGYKGIARIVGYNEPQILA